MSNTTGLNGTFDNQTTQQRETWVNGECVSGVHAREIQQSSGSTKYLYPFGHYPDVPASQVRPVGVNTVIAALCEWYSDDVMFNAVSEESARYELSKEDDPIEVIGKALDLYAQDLSFDAATNVVIKWLNDHANPHSAILITCDNAILFSGERTNPNKEFIKD